MRVLIVTQKVDRTDPILGFFHRWLLQFAKRCDRVVVIGQKVGNFDLPENVEVHSLGKEDGASIWMQILRFWKLQWTLRKQYDVVLVHMTPVWIDLGAPLWLLLRKPMYLWYEVRRGGWVLRIALLFVRKVFSATQFGLPFASSKQIVVGHGIDTDAFKPGDAARNQHLLFTIGRVTRIKRFDRLLEAFAQLPDQYRFVIAGGPLLPGDHEVVAGLERGISQHHLEKRVEIRFHSEREVIAELQHARLFLHASGGGLDKVVLEAMSCGCPVLSAGEASPSVLPPECVTTVDHLPERLKEALQLDPHAQQTIGERLRATVVEKHSLPMLVERLVREMAH